MSIVVKISGSGEINPEPVLEDIGSLIQSGEDVVMVHGGSSELDNQLNRLNIEPEYVKTPKGMKSRFTDEETMEVFNMVMAGKINVEYTSKLIQLDIDAVGVSGIDAELFKGPRKSAVKVLEDGKKKIKRGEHSGKVEDVNTSLIEIYLENGYTPVISLPMLGDDGTPVNADGDRAAAALAGELNTKLIILTDVPGVLRDPESEDSLISEVDDERTMDEVKRVSEGFMRKKVLAAKEALEKGSEEVIISGFEGPNPVKNALKGKGTKITRGAI